MERKSGFKNVDDFISSPDDIKQKLACLKRISNPFFKKMDNTDRAKFYMALIPEDFIEKARNFYRLVKVKNSVKVYTRHKVVVDYDTLYLAKQINESNRDEYLLITNARLSLMRSIICLYLAFSRESEYDRGWSHISYALMSLAASEEDTFIIFSHLVQNIIPGFFLASDNNTEKLKTITEFYTLAERQKISFSNPNHQSIFKSSNKISSVVLDYSDPKTRMTFFNDEMITNYGLYILLKSACSDWFGALFSNVLYPKECLILWDNLLINNFRVLYRFGISILNKSNSKLEQIIKKERKGFTELGVEAAQHLFLLTSPSLKKQLMSVIPPSEFTSIMSGAQERRDSTMLVNPDRKASYVVQEIASSLFQSRLKHFNELKRELEATIPLDTGRILTFFQMIDDHKTDKITSREFITMFAMNQVASPGLLVKLFTIIDQGLKGSITKKEGKSFFAAIADTFERKIKLFWKESFKGSTIDANEALEILQNIDNTVNYDSTIFFENLSLVYDRLVKKIAEPSITVEALTNFVKKEKICSALARQLYIIDGREIEEGIIVGSESYDDERTDSKLDKFNNRSQRFSSPTYGELSSKGRVSITGRKSGFGFGIEVERSGKDDLMSEETVQAKYEDPIEKQDPTSLILNTEENLSGIQPPAFVVRSPIMSSKLKL